MTQEVRWVLARAFGPLPDPGEGPHAGSSGGALARTLDLAPRIATRQERERLVLEVGAEGARALASARGVAAVAADDLLGAALDVRDAARGLGAPVPIVLLKGVALTATGVAVPGSRWLGDVDILCPAWALESLAAALRERGYARVEGVPTCDHQLAPLRGRSGRVVELHRFLPGVRLRGAPGFATAEELAERDLLRSPTGALHGCWVPSRDVLGAHALVHGIAQHGLSPRSYPLMRMLADLVDLGWGAPGHGEAAAAAADLTARHVSRDEREAVLDLCRRLRAGEALPDRLTRRAGPAHRLLGHVLAGSLDPSYSDSLKLRALGSGPSLSPRPLVWLREAGRALFPGRARMEALHGEPVGRGASGMRRVLRLASMVWRAALALHGAWVTRTRPVLAIGALAARPGGAVESSLDTR